jgi:uncharacterized protein
MNNLNTIKSVLSQHKNELALKYRVKDIGIFGSVARGEQKKTSDIDFLVDFDDNASLLDLVGLGLFLEEKLKQKVDIVSRRALRKELKDAVLKEVIPL